MLCLHGLYHQYRSNDESIASSTSKEFLKKVAVCLADVLEPSSEARFVCHASYPQNLVYANVAWTKLTGYHQHEVAGHTLSVLQGPMTNMQTIHKMSESVRSAGYAEAHVVNYRKDGTPYYCSIRIHPVVSRDNYGEKYLSHFVGIVKELSLDQRHGGSSSTMSQLTDSESDTSSNSGSVAIENISVDAEQ